MTDHINFDLVTVDTPDGLRQFPCEHTDTPHLRISASGMDSEGRPAFGGWSIVVVPFKSVLPVPVPHCDQVETLRWMTTELAEAGIDWEASKETLAAAVAPVLRDLIRQADEADQERTPPGELSVSTLRRITEGNARALAKQAAGRG